MGKNDNSHPTIVDLSHTIEDGMITYPGLPAPRISEYLNRGSYKKNLSGKY